MAVDVYARMVLTIVIAVTALAMPASADAQRIKTALSKYENCLTGLDVPEEVLDRAENFMAEANEAARSGDQEAEDDALSKADDQRIDYWIDADACQAEYAEFDAATASLSQEDRHGEEGKLIGYLEDYASYVTTATYMLEYPPAEDTSIPQGQAPKDSAPKASAPQSKTPAAKDPKQEFAEAMKDGRIWKPVKIEGLGDQCNTVDGAAIFDSFTLIEVKKTADANFGNWVFEVLYHQRPKVDERNDTPIECTVPDALFMKMFVRVTSSAELPKEAPAPQGPTLIQKIQKCLQDNYRDIDTLPPMQQLEANEKCRQAVQ